MKKEGSNPSVDNEISDEQATKEIRGWAGVLKDRIEEIEASEARKELHGWAGELEKILKRNFADKKER